MAKTDWQYGDIVTHDDMNVIGNEINTSTRELSDGDLIPVNLQPGLQVINAPRKSRVRNIKLPGRSLVNLLGRDGNFETLVGTAEKLLPPNFIQPVNTFSTTTGSSDAKFGQQSFSISTASNRSMLFDWSNYIGKYVIVGVWYKKVADLDHYLRIRDSISQENTPGTTIIQVSDGEENKWKFAYGKLKITNQYLTLSTVQSGTSATLLDGMYVYEISEDEYNAIDNMTPEEVETRYPYVDDMKHVNAVHITNPGKNLLPPFSEWTSANPDFMTVLEPYKLQISSQDNLGYVQYVEVDVIPHTDYTFSVENNGRIAVYEEGGTTAIIHFTPTQSLTFNTGNRNRIRISCAKLPEPGATIHKNPILNIGSEPLPFEPQQPSYLYLPDVQLRSNVDGSVVDQLYMDSEGKPRVTRRLREIVLDGSLEWGFSAGYTDYKNIIIAQANIPGTQPNNTNLTAIKYNGSPLASLTGAGAGDQVYFGSSNLSITIFNDDSGWGQDYTPTVDEIKAYFNGWRMADNSLPISIPENKYNGSGTKCWYRFDLSRPPQYVDESSRVFTVPTELNTHGRWTPYRLIYQIAQSVDEAVKYEGELMLHEGDNQIEVGTGIVVREAVPNVYSYQGAKLINAAVAGYSLKYRVNTFIDVCKNNIVEQWNTYIVATESTKNAIGYEQKKIPNELFDPTAAYSVTYEALDKYLIGIAPQSITAETVPNTKEAIDDLTRGLVEAKKQLSVLQNIKAQKQQSQWIEPTLLNGWIKYSEQAAPPSYFKDDRGFVYFRGSMKDGVGTGGTELFYLPREYRPSRNIYFTAVYYDGTGYRTVALAISSFSGSVYIPAIPSLGGTSALLSLDEISFYSGQ